MQDPCNVSLGPNRRTVIGGLAAIGAGLRPSLAQAQPTGPFEDRIAAYVRAMPGMKTATLSVLLPSGSGTSVQPIARTFTEMTGVPVTLTEVAPTELNGELLLEAMAGGNRFDVALPATFGLPDLAKVGAILPVENFARTHEPPGFRDGMIYDHGSRVADDLYGYHTDGDAYVMFYHRDMMEDPSHQAGYADRYGTALGLPDTWEELDRQMRYFHDPDNDRYGGSLFRLEGYVAWEWWSRFLSKGVWPFDAEMQPNIEGEAGLSALEAMLASQDYLDPQTLTMGLVENWRHFDVGNVFCNIGWGGTQKYLNRAEGRMRGRLLHAQLPGGHVKDELLRLPYFNWGWNYVVTRAAALPELAYLFTLFASGPRMSTVAVRQTDSFFDPHRPAHYDDPAIQKAYSPAFLKVQRAALEGAMPDLYLPGQSEYFSALNEGISLALKGEETATAALSRVAQRWQLTTSRLGRQRQIDAWEKLRAMYPPQAQRLLQLNA